MWIQSHPDLAQNPKLLRLSKMLGISNVQAVGHLHFLWWWCSRYAPNGCLQQYTNEEIAAASEWCGDAEKFVTQLIKTGWIDEGEMTIHNWQLYTGGFLENMNEKREQNKERQKQYRKRLHRNALRNKNVTVTEARDVTVTRNALSRARGEERREEEIREEKRDNILFASDQKPDANKKIKTQKESKDTSGYRSVIDHILKTYETTKKVKYPFTEKDGAIIKSLISSSSSIGQLMAMWDVFISQRWDWKNSDGNHVIVPHDLIQFRRLFTKILEIQSWKQKATQYDTELLGSFQAIPLVLKSIPDLSAKSFDDKKQNQILAMENQMRGAENVG